MKRLTLLLLATVALAGCGGSLLDLNLVVVGEQTALERQVLGSYRALGTDLQAYASVRAVQPDGSLSEKPVATPSQTAALRAMQNREYNRDDLDLLLANGVLGERNDGMLERLIVPLPPVERITPALIERIVQEENRDRATILERLRATVPEAKDAPPGEIEWIFAGTNFELAPAASQIQERDGTWRAK